MLIPSKRLTHTSLMTLQGGDSKQGDLRIKRFMTMIDSMTEKELNSSDLKMLSQRSRVERISRGAGRRPEEFLELLGGLTFANVRSTQAGPELTLLGHMRKVPVSILASLGL